MKRNKRGKKTDKILLDTIKQYPGLSKYELARELKWNIGHIDGSVERLLRAHEIFIKVMERQGRQVNLIHPIGTRAKPSNTIEVPQKLLDVQNPSWTEHAFFYALDGSTIGISGNPIEEWDEVAGFKKRVPVEKSATKISLTIPENFIQFYDLNRKAYLSGISGGNIFLTITGEIVKTKESPT